MQIYCSTPIIKLTDSKSDSKSDYFEAIMLTQIRLALMSFDKLYILVNCNYYPFLFENSVGYVLYPTLNIGHT